MKQKKNLKSKSRFDNGRWIVTHLGRLENNDKTPPTMSGLASVEVCFV